jgi:hypothetical protein
MLYEVGFWVGAVRYMSVRSRFWPTDGGVRGTDGGGGSGYGDCPLRFLGR